MIRRLSIPWSVRWYAALTIFCVGCTFLLWSAHVWTPVQRHYLWTYLWCSRPGVAPSSQVTVRWIWKTAPDKNPELAAPNDAISSARNGHSKLAMAISPAARRAEWTGLLLGPKDRFPAIALKSFIQEQFFDGSTVWRIFLMPFLWGLALCCCLILGVEWIKSRLPFALQMLKLSRFGQAWNRLRAALDTVARFRQVGKTAPSVAPGQVPRKLPQPAYSPFGANAKTAKSAFAWSKKDEIE
jgi:hypothetical protein